MDEPPAWTPLRTRDGSTTLENVALDEACHSRAGAWLESRERYARETCLADRAKARDFDGGTCRLLDVGTGLGLNLAAALEALDGSGVALDATTLELDPRVIRAGLGLGAGPAACWHSIVATTLETALARPGAWVPFPRPDSGTAPGRLRLLVGDGRETLPALPPDEAFDAVFLDPFSPRTDPALWEPAFLAEVARRMAPRSRLSTYCATFEVRARLAEAGLRVGLGARVAEKAEGTLASPDAALPPLHDRVGRRLARRLAGGAGASQNRPPDVSSPPGMA